MKDNVFVKKVGKTGHSLQVSLPVEAKAYGFRFGSEVELIFESNRITINLKEKKETYYSRISRFFIQDGFFRPVWNESNKSVRFQELDHLLDRNPGGYDLKLYLDHAKMQYIAFACSNDEHGYWFGRYITESEYKTLENGADPFPILIED